MECSCRRPWTICHMFFKFFKAVLYGYYKQALVTSYIPDDPHSFKSICLTCNTAHNNYYLGRNITCVLLDSNAVFTFFLAICVLGLR